MQFTELNLDGLVGPSHHYAGLAKGNLASFSNALSVANPLEAASQGLAKMRFLHQLGLKQALLPPHQRPNLALLHQLGFTGNPAEQVAKAKRQAPEILSACYSAASMWTANAATVSASPDTSDHRVHITAANLVSNLHRSQEADFSMRVLAKIFADENLFVHHFFLAQTTPLGDEGAANHSRLCANHASPGINLFVYGQQSLQKSSKKNGPLKYPARQTLEASQAIARSHQLNPQKIIFARQNPRAIDRGVFHNDVIAVANENVLLIHEEALVEQAKIIKLLKKQAGFPLTIIEIPKTRLSLAQAVDSYFFNSQLISLNHSPQKHMLLLAASECRTHRQTQTLIDQLLADDSNPISAVHYLNLKQSMRNGGGPACLRLRVPLNTMELAAMHQGVLITDSLLNQLEQWLKRHYRSHLHPDDLADPLLINECFTALDELTTLLGLGAIYPFQTIS